MLFLCQVLTNTGPLETDVNVLSFFCCTHKLSDGVSSHGSVGDPVLPHRTLCVVPADGEGVGGGIKHTHVPGTGTGHCNQNTDYTRLT